MFKVFGLSRFLNDDYTLCSVCSGAHTFLLMICSSPPVRFINHCFIARTSHTSREVGMCRLTNDMQFTICMTCKPLVHDPYDLYELLKDTIYDPYQFVYIGHGWFSNGQFQKISIHNDGQLQYFNPPCLRKFQNALPPMPSEFHNN